MAEGQGDAGIAHQGGHAGLTGGSIESAAHTGVRDDGGRSPRVGEREQHQRPRSIWLSSVVSALGASFRRPLSRTLRRPGR